MRKTVKVRLTFIEELLGTASSDPEIHREFIASKSPDAKTIEDEVAAVGSEAVFEKSMTIFPKENGRPFIYDYQIKGFLKDACSALSRVPDTVSKEMKAYKKVIDGLIFPQPRMIFLQMPEGTSGTGRCQRPLRAATAQGERIALATSETVPVGTFLEFDILLLDEKLEKLVIELLDYGLLRGLGQWRNSGKGRVTYEIVNQPSQK